jgi:predicted branched-subunit amino acid permease
MHPSADGTDTATAHPDRPRRTDAIAGARAMIPLLAGVTPMGLVIGVAVVQSGIPVAVGLATGPLIYAGSAQLAIIDLLRQRAPLLIVMVSVLAINARLALYGTVLAGRWRTTPRWWRALAAYLLIDPSFIIGVDGYQQRRGHAYYLGGAVVLWLGWQASIVAGAVIGSAVAPSLELDFVAILYLVAMAVLKATEPAVRVGVVAAAVAAAVGALLPIHSGPVIGIVAGVAAALAYPAPRSPA